MTDRLLFQAVATMLVEFVAVVKKLELAAYSNFFPLVSIISHLHSRTFPRLIRTWQSWCCSQVLMKYLIR